MIIYPLQDRLNQVDSNPTDQQCVRSIQQQISHDNKDNVSRTKAYAHVYKIHPEIKWAFLASMVSRNAGWNMCDLEGEWLPKVLSVPNRRQLYLTYERANWLIFQDAYAQLLIYHYTTKYKRDLFHLLAEFHISKFMQKEWKLFYSKGDEKRLLYALIFNEQHLIQKPIIEHPDYQDQVFKKKVFWLQDMLHYSCVVFPTLKGELYGASISHFQNRWERFKLGKRLAKILFHPKLKESFVSFSNETEPTGSRWDYEQYQSNKRFRTTPYLRKTFRIIHHNVHAPELVKWENYFRVKKGWERDEKIIRHPLLTHWFEGKKSEMKAFIELEQAFINKKMKSKKK